MRTAETNDDLWVVHVCHDRPTEGTCEVCGLRNAGRYVRVRACAFTIAEVQAAVDEMVREDDYSPEDARIRIEQILTGHV